MRAPRKPFLRTIATLEERVDPTEFPFTLPLLKNGFRLDLTTMVTLLVGENGSGKSTLLEAIAQQCRFNPEGGSKFTNFGTREETSPLARALRLSWSTKVFDGFFLRAESFFNFASYLDRLNQEDARALLSYGGRSLHEQSHGDAFLALFNNRFEQGIYILDEPEAALSPQRQLAFLALVHQLEQSGMSQFLIATHSPILLAYAGATLFSLDGSSIQPIDYHDTDHYRITKSFLESPERYFRHLFSDE